MKKKKMRLILILKKQRNFVFFQTNILSLSNVCLLYWNFKNKRTKEQKRKTNKKLKQVNRLYPNLLAWFGSKDSGKATKTNIIFHTFFLPVFSSQLNQKGNQKVIPKNPFDSVPNYYHIFPKRQFALLIFFVFPFAFVYDFLFLLFFSPICYFTES